MSDAASKELIEMTKRAGAKLAELEGQVKEAEHKKAAAEFVLESVHDGHIDPDDVFEFYEKVASEGVGFFKKAIAMGLNGGAESFGTLIDREDVAGVMKTASIGVTIAGNSVDNFSRGVFQLKHMLYGVELPYDM